MLTYAESAFAANEVRVIKCFENNRFSAAVSYATQGTRFNGVATAAAQAGEILPAFSVAADLKLSPLKEPEAVSEARIKNMPAAWSSRE